VFVGPTVGFLVGWPVAAIVIGLIHRRLRARAPLWGGVAACLTGGVGALYALGVAGLMAVTGMSAGAALLAVLIFIPGDVLKAVAAAFIAREIARARPDLAS
jgi:biotin transport system substrate-specific component